MITERSREVDIKDGTVEAGLFEAIAHPTRIKILFCLCDGPMGFAELKHRLLISSSGNLQHHLGKLVSLVGLNKWGDYILTDSGQDAIVTIKSLRNTQSFHSNFTQNTSEKKLSTFAATIGYYVLQMNMPFILGDVEPITPVYALFSSLVFAMIFYLIFGFVENRRMDKK